MKRHAFETLVQEAWRSIPAPFRKRLQNVAVLVEDDPSPELLAEMGIEPPDTLFGLYHGTPLTERSWGFGNQLPDRIVIYRRPILDACAGDEDAIFEEVCATMIHEAGHYFGLSEEEIEAIEERWWNGDDLEDEGSLGPAFGGEPRKR